MLFTRGMGALFLGLTATASVLTRNPSKTDTQIQLSRGNLVEASHHGSDHSSTDRSIGRASFAKTKKGTRWSPRGLRANRLHSRDDPNSLNSTNTCPPNTTTCSSEVGQVECCSEGFTCCLLENGRFGCCPITTCDGFDCEGASPALIPDTPFSTFAGVAAATVFVTQTVTNTITEFTGLPTTGLVVVTNTIPITVINPIEQTQTITVTATSFFRRQQAVQDAPKATAIPENVEAGNVEKRQQEATITSTTTVEVFTTVFQQSVILATLTNSVFTTTFVAPNAVTTVFVTTTVFLPSGAIPSTAPPTAPGSTFVPVPSTTALITSNPPSSTASTSSSISSSSSSEISTSSETTMIMETMSMRTPTTTNTPVPTPSMIPMSAPATGLSTTQIIGIVIGALIGILVIVALAFCLRRLVQRRRAAQAQMRQQLTPPEIGPPLPTAAIPRRGPSGGGGMAIVPATLPATSSGNSGSDSSASDPSNNSFLTGEGEVRIVIRPAPKRRTQSSQLWPMPPGHRGQTYSLFVEETTTGETTPQDPGEWSIASEMGSVKDGKEGQTGTVIYSTNDPGSGSEERASGSGGRPTTSLFSSAWDRDTIYGRRSDVSYPGLGTLLTPPPAWHGHAAERGWPQDPAITEENSRRTSIVQPGQSTAQAGSSRQQQQGGSPSRDENRDSVPYPKLSLGIGKAW